MRTCLIAQCVLAIAISGCASTTTSNTARTAREQLLISNAVDQSLNKVDFSPLRNQTVFVQDKYLECTDKSYVVGSIRHRVMRAGGLLVEKPEDANIIMEARSGGVGTDTSESFVGFPEIALPGLLTLPEIRIAERKTQFGYSKIGLVIFDAKSRNVLGDGGMAMAQADDENWYMFGIGPFQSGTLLHEIDRAEFTPAGASRRQLPATVAFGNRSPFAEEPTIQFASGSEESP